MKRLPEILLSAAWCLLMALTLGSCVYDDGIDMPEEPDAEACDVSFRFNIYAGDAKGTRGLGEWEEDPADVAERILSPSDMRVMVFDGSGALLTSVSPGGLDYKVDPTANDGYYSLSVFFTSPYFGQYDATDDVSFFVVILANLESIGGSYTTFPYSSTLYHNVQESFTMSPEWFPAADRGIPMYGFQSFRVKKSQLTQSESFTPIGTISMLRAVSKVEVYDKIVNAKVGADGLKYPRVTGVEMISWVDDGYLAPRSTDYPLGLSSANIPPFATAATRSVRGVPVDGTFRFYCPEAKLKDMRFRVAALLEPGGETQYYEVSLGQYEADYGTADMVRNHIYRFEVHAVNTVAELTVTAADWDTGVDEYELKDVVSMEPDGYLEWSSIYPDDFSVTTVTYGGIEEKQLSMLNATSGYATGTFHIQSPKGSRWKAYFIPGENGVDAFEFVDVDDSGAVIPGSGKVIAEGDVGKRAVIHIRGKGPADIYRHTAELVVEVHSLDGTIQLATLTPQSTRYIIYRENKF